MSEHEHNWVFSVNSNCPACNGQMQLCESSECSRYRCISGICSFRNSAYVMGKTKFNENELVRIPHSGEGG